MTDANISFSISLPLDQALELLAPIQKKRIGIVQIGNSVKQSKSSDLPKGQPAKKEQVPVFKGVPITTLNNVIDSLVSNYKDKPAFSYAEARHLTQENVSRTLLSYTLAFAIQQGQIHNLGYGHYSFAAQKHQPNLESLLDLVSESTESLTSVFRTMSKVSDNVHLYFNEQGISARFSNESKNAMLDVKLDKSMFSVYHVKHGHARLSLSSKELSKVLSKNRGKPFTLALQDRKNVFNKAREHLLHVTACEVSQSAYDIEKPLDPAKADCEVSMPRLLFEDIIKNVELHSEEIRLSARAGGTLMFDAFESSSYHKGLIHDGKGISLQCSADVTACFNVETILDLVNARALKTDRISLSLSKDVLVLKVIDRPSCHCNYYVVPCRVEEAKPEQPASSSPPKEQLRDLERCVDALPDSINNHKQQD